MSGAEANGEVTSPPHPEESGLDGDPLDRREALVAPEAGPICIEFPIGRLHLPDTGLEAGVIAIAVEGRLLVALPEALWSRTTAERLLGARALTKPALCAIAACHTLARDIPVEGVSCRVWIGFASRTLEQELDFSSEGTLHYDFSPAGETDLVPLAVALVDVARDHFTFVTATSAVPDCSTPLQEQRFAGLEESMRQMQEHMSLLMGQMQSLVHVPAPAVPKAQDQGARGSQKGKAKKPEKSAEAVAVPGLDPESVKAALSAGVPLEHLREVGAVLKSKPSRLDDLPRKKPLAAKVGGPLSESEDLSEGEGEDGSEEDGLQDGSETKQIQKAVLHLATIAKNLTKPKEKKDKLEKPVRRRQWVSHWLREQLKCRHQEAFSGPTSHAEAFGGGPEVPVSSAGSKPSERLPGKTCGTRRASERRNHCERVVSFAEPDPELHESCEMELAGGRYLGCPDCWPTRRGTCSLRAPDCLTADQAAIDGGNP